MENDQDFGWCVYLAPGSEAYSSEEVEIDFCESLPSSTGSSAEEQPESPLPIAYARQSPLSSDWEEVTPSSVDHDDFGRCSCRPLPTTEEIPLPSVYFSPEVRVCKQKTRRSSKSPLRRKRRRIIPRRLVFEDSPEEQPDQDQEKPRDSEKKSLSDIFSIIVKQASNCELVLPSGRPKRSQQSDWRRWVVASKPVGLIRGKPILFPKLMLQRSNSYEGMGVFAAEFIPKKALITEYGGRLIDRTEAERLRQIQQDTHTIRVEKGLIYLDCRIQPHLGYSYDFYCQHHLVGGFVNSFTDPAEQNCRVHYMSCARSGYSYPLPSQHLQSCDRAAAFTLTRVLIKATRDIEAGEEIVTSYGSSFWKLRDRPPV